MGDDIVTRLRHMAWAADEGEPYADAASEAADEIERLRAHIKKLAATHPLAAEYRFGPDDPTKWIPEEARRG